MRRSTDPDSPEGDFARWRQHADAKALERVFDRLAPELLIVAAHVAEAGVAEDLVQATFLTAIRRAESWDDARPLRPWLVGILTKQALKERERQRRTIDPERVTLSNVPDPPTEAERVELAQAVASALEDLPLHYRQVLTLRLVHGLEPTAIAHALGAPVATVKSRLQRGIARLRDALPSGLHLPAALLVPTVSLESMRAAVVAEATRSAIAAAAATVPAATTAATHTTLPLIGATLMTKSTVAVVAIAILVVLGVTQLGGSDAGDGSDGTIEARKDDAPSRTASSERSRELETAGGAPERRAPSAEGTPEAASESRTDPAVEAAAEAPTPGVVRGRVLDDRGRPLPDIAVFLGDQRLRPFRDVEQFLASVRSNELTQLATQAEVQRCETDDDGAFELERPDSEHPQLVVAWSAERGGRGVVLPPDGDLEIVLPIDAVVAGVVRSNVDGAPIEDARVQVWPAKSGYPIAYERTDASGEYELQRLPPGEYRVRFEADGHADRNETFALLERQTELDLSASLDPLPEFRARLVDAAGSPWSAARLEGALGGDRAPGARWSVSLTESSFARRGELDVESWRVQWMEFESDGTVAGFVELPEARVLALWRGSEKVLEGTVPDFDATEVLATLTDRATVDLRVRVRFDPPADDAPEIRIGLTDPSGFGRNGTPIVERTTTEGESTLRVPAQFIGNRCGLEVMSEGHVPYSGRLTVPDGTSNVWHEVVLSPPARTVSGLVVDASGAPVADAQIVLVATDGEAFLPWRLTAKSTGIDGTFRIEGLPARPLLAMVSAPELAVECFEVDPASTEDLRLELREARTFDMRMPRSIGAGQLRIVDVNGRPQLDDRVSGTVRYGGAALLVNEDAATVELYDAASGALVARGDVPAAGELVLEPVD